MSFAGKVAIVTGATANIGRAIALALAKAASVHADDDDTEVVEDVAAAAKQASDSVAKMKAPSDQRTEPWPPMRVGAGL